MKNATLRQLRVFDAVARHSSFSRAAEELHLTQPAVSTQIKQLATHAGLPLFEQLGKRIYLTPAGEALLAHARAIIGQFRAAEEAMAGLRGVSGGKLNVAVISAGDYFFPRLLAEFTRRHRDVAVNLGVHNREELLRQMAGNLTDLAIMVGPPQGADIVSEPFAPHPYVIVAAPNHPLARRRRIPMDVLLGERFVVREPGSDTWNAMRLAFGRRLPRLNVALEIRDDQASRDRRHGGELPVRAHDQPRDARAQSRRARRPGLSVLAQLVRRASAQQAPAAGCTGVPKLPARGRRGADRADYRREARSRPVASAQPARARILTGCP
jgi:DNA-binding transcriptional LysR family regulator